MRTRRAARRRVPPVLLLALLALSVLGVGGCGSAPSAATPPAPAQVTVHIRNFGFHPAEVRVRAGGTVTWVNDDGVEHTATADSGSWGSPTLAQGQRFSHRFDRTGRFGYHCVFHAFMTGTVTVVS